MMSDWDDLFGETVRENSEDIFPVVESRAPSEECYDVMDIDSGIVEGRGTMSDEAKVVEKKPKYKTEIDFTASGQLRVPKGFADVREAIRGGMSAEDAANEFDKDVEICRIIAAKLADAPVKPKKSKKADAEVEEVD